MSDKRINILKPITDLLSGNFFGKEFVQKNMGVCSVSNFFGDVVYRLWILCR